MLQLPRLLLAYPTATQPAASLFQPTTFPVIHPPPATSADEKTYGQLLKEKEDQEEKENLQTKEGKEAEQIIITEDKIKHHRSGRVERHERRKLERELKLRKRHVKHQHPQQHNHGEKHQTEEKEADQNSSHQQHPANIIHRVSGPSWSSIITTFNEQHERVSPSTTATKPDNPADKNDNESQQPVTLDDKTGQPDHEMNRSIDSQESQENVLSERRDNKQEQLQETMPTEAAKSDEPISDNLDFDTDHSDSSSIISSIIDSPAISQNPDTHFSLFPVKQEEELWSTPQNKGGSRYRQDRHHQQLRYNGHRSPISYDHDNNRHDQYRMRSIWSSLPVDDNQDTASIWSKSTVSNRRRQQPSASAIDLGDTLPFQVLTVNDIPQVSPVLLHLPRYSPIGPISLPPFRPLRAHQVAITFDDGSDNEVEIQHDHHHFHRHRNNDGGRDVTLLPDEESSLDMDADNTGGIRLLHIPRVTNKWKGIFKNRLQQVPAELHSRRAAYATRDALDNNPSTSRRSRNGKGHTTRTRHNELLSVVDLDGDDDMYKESTSDDKLLALAKKANQFAEQLKKTVGQTETHVNQQEQQQAKLTSSPYETAAGTGDSATSTLPQTISQQQLTNATVNKSPLIHPAKPIAVKTHPKPTKSSIKPFENAVAITTASTVESNRVVLMANSNNTASTTVDAQAQVPMNSNPVHKDANADRTAVSTNHTKVSAIQQPSVPQQTSPAIQYVSPAAILLSSANPLQQVQQQLKEVDADLARLEQLSQQMQRSIQMGSSQADNNTNNNSAISIKSIQYLQPQFQRQQSQPNDDEQQRMESEAKQLMARFHQVVQQPISYAAPVSKTTMGSTARRGPLSFADIVAETEAAQIKSSSAITSNTKGNMKNNNNINSSIPTQSIHPSLTPVPLPPPTTPSSILAPASSTGRGSASSVPVASASTMNKRLSLLKKKKAFPVITAASSKTKKQPISTNRKSKAIGTSSSRGSIVKSAAAPSEAELFAQAQQLIQQFRDEFNSALSGTAEALPV